jgi:peptidoglycan/LPS O-acetylase OafA/YrhL
MTRLAYRPDIDGLRAIAIGTVVLYHAFPGFLPGGFIGVDIFFVISGVLISGIVFTEMQVNRFSFIQFYVRRICRIFPALALVLTLTCAVGWLWLLPADWLRLGQEVRGGAFFFANFVFLNQAGYFDQASVQKPLLHLWSLAIEEQFYLAWPLAVFLVYRNRIALGTLIWSGLIGSFVLNVVLVATEPVATFYMPATRAWELLVGCLLAYRAHFSETATARSFAAIESVVSSDVRAIVGLAFIVYGAVCFDSHQLFPGWRALLPTLGAALLISAGPKAAINRVLLANRVGVFIGLISYPLYLWHWPILSFATIYKGAAPGIGERALLVCLAVACSIATFYLIERPIRLSRPFARRAAAAAWGVFCASIGVVGHLISLNDIESNASRFGLNRIVSAAGEWSYPTADLTAEAAHGQVLRKLIGSDGPNSVLFFGDSNMEMYWPRVQFLASHNALASRDTIYFLTYGGCAPMPGVTEIKHPYCAGLVNAAQAIVKEKDIKTIVFGAHWWGYLGSNSAYRYNDQSMATPGARTAAISALATIMRSMVADRRKVYAIMNIPFGNAMDPLTMVQRRIISFDVVSIPIALSNLTEDIAITAELRRALEPAGVKIVDPLSYLCNGGVCPTITRDGDPIYRDAMHLRPKYVRSDVFYLDQVLE